MIRSYPDVESAAIAVAELKNQGHFAALMDEYSAVLWGPTAVAGVRVISSAQSSGGTPPPLPRSKSIEALLKVLSLMAVSLSAIVTEMIAIQLLDLIFSNFLSVLTGSALVLAIFVIVFSSAIIIGIGAQKLIRWSIQRSERGETIIDGLLFLFYLFICSLIFMIGGYG